MPSARALGTPFTYQGQTFRYRSVALYRRTGEGDWTPVDWRCPGDAPDAATDRGPLDPGGFPTAAAARAAGCAIAAL